MTCSCPPPSMMRWSPDHLNWREVLTQRLICLQVVEAMRRNIQFNGETAQQRVVPTQGDARIQMLQSPMVGQHVLAEPEGSLGVGEQAVQQTASG